MKMKTIPLEPIYENTQFQMATPVLKCGVINAVYWLSQRGKLSLPLPPYLFPMIDLSYSSYLRYKDGIREILVDVIPKILDIKRTFDYRREKQAIGQAKKRLETPQINRKNMQFSDKSDSHLEITPVIFSRENWNKGQYDHVERAKALQPKTNKDVVFTDKPTH